MSIHLRIKKDSTWSSQKRLIHLRIRFGFADDAAFVDPEAASAHEVFFVVVKPPEVPRVKRILNLFADPPAAEVVLPIPTRDHTKHLIPRLVHERLDQEGDVVAVHVLVTIIRPPPHRLLFKDRIRFKIFVTSNVFAQHTVTLPFGTFQAPEVDIVSVRVTAFEQHLRKTLRSHVAPSGL